MQNNPTLKIYIAQIKPKVADLEHNYNLILSHYNKALAQQCDLCVFPELALIGYIPMDLLHNNYFTKQVEYYTAKLVAITKSTMLLIPTVIPKGRKLLNTVIAAQLGQIATITSKKYLANEGVFDEERYFVSGNSQIITCNGIKIGIPICEDLWFEEVANIQKEAGAELLIVPNASPFDRQKFTRRLKVAQQRFAEVGLPIIYCNQVLGHDGIIYDGRSFIYNDGIQFELKAFREDEAIVEYNNGNFKYIATTANNYTLEDITYSAMVLGLRDYIEHNGFKQALIGLSGGIDSALVAAIAVDAIGPDNVKSVMLATKFTSTQSIDDAKECASLLGIEHIAITIDDIVDNAALKINSLTPLAHENLQARTRGMLLMGIANSENRLLLATSNKSESAVGYNTLYGDTCGAFNPIRDLYKTEVYKVATYRCNNSLLGIDSRNPKVGVPIMPSSILTKAPSAELRDNQKDSDSLPEYAILDHLLEMYLEQDMRLEEIMAQSNYPEKIYQVLKLINKAEYKRRQSPPGVKLTPKAFNQDRRYPITNGFQ